MLASLEGLSIGKRYRTCFRVQGAARCEGGCQGRKYHYAYLQARDVTHGFDMLVFINVLVCDALIIAHRTRQLKLLQQENN
jgi:hypothetical protein